MFSTLLIALVAAAAAVHAAPIDTPENPRIFTATRVYQTITDVEPYIITATTIMTWTAGPSTTVAFPTGPGGF
ncbi:hypothetical protein B0H15DRAFT_954963 [Mycena belliarum]|uniref:Uncharacterized protein n=1 Tax=Mycena belliarum TaxID=1033014 RepID=A0AAD6TS71_9AGAR|nr:hypothetical protein B0H15DRAFT_954963 [Mycena belliae]